MSFMLMMLGYVTLSLTFGKVLAKPRVDLRGNLADKRLGWCDIYKNPVVRVPQHFLHCIVRNERFSRARWSYNQEISTLALGR